MSFMDYFNRSVAKIEANDLQGAIADLDKSLELAPDYYASWFKRASVQEKLGKFKDAETDYAKCINAFPDLDIIDQDLVNARYKSFLAFTHFKLGRLKLEKLNKKQEGLDQLKKAAEHGDNNAAELLKLYN
jgi:tetratricopeptide (TPR) repeat protein